MPSSSSTEVDRRPEAACGTCVPERPNQDTSPSAENLLTAAGASVVESVCRVCGLHEGEDRWTGRDGAQYVSCSSCGAAAGVDDLDVAAVRRYRTDRQNPGAAWFSPEERPANWRLDSQMEQVPAAWRWLRQPQEWVSRAAHSRGQGEEVLAR